MRVVFVWPDCNFHNEQWTYDRQKIQDSFVVQATVQEAEQHIVPHLTKPGRPKPGGPSAGNEFEHYLISRDRTTSVIGIHWNYPVSHMWNGASPFIYMEKPINILADLQDLKCDIPTHG